MLRGGFHLFFDDITKCLVDLDILHNFEHERANVRVIRYEGILDILEY